MSNPPAYKENNATGAMLTWVAFVGIFAIAFTVIAIANFTTRPKAAVDADLVAKRQALLKENSARAHQLISEPGKNADGTYRIPVDAAVQVLLRDPKGLHLVETLARKQAPATTPPAETKPVATPEQNTAQPKPANPQAS